MDFAPLGFHYLRLTMGVLETSTRALKSSVLMPSPDHDSWLCPRSPYARPHPSPTRDNEASIRD